MMRLRLMMTYAALALGLMVALKAYAADPAVTVFKDPTCGCCGAWAEHLKKAGFPVSVDESQNMVELKNKYGVPRSLQSCHTAIVDGYVIEGHVPAADIQRLLRERPKIKGLAVPGMPLGSPGMEVGDSRQSYSVIAWDSTGKTTIFQAYPAK